MAIPPDTRLGQYQVIDLLGRGGMGEVYRAKDTRLGRQVAIKVLPDVFSHAGSRFARFQREAQTLASLNHPNIATIHGMEQSGDTHYLVMELVAGETLAQRLAREGPLPVREALEICGQVAEALEAAHKNGITHRDIKPDNIQLTPEEQVKVLDFGLAKAFEDQGAGPDLSQLPTVDYAPTQEGQIVGTPAYMSPEQVRGKAVDKRTDIWAFGCVLYELLTGKRAFPGDTLPDTIAAVLEREPDWSALPPATPGKIRDLLRRCLQKDPRRRLRDIGDARIEIEDTSAGPAEAVRMAAGGRRIQRRALLAVGALLAVALLLGALDIGGWREKALGRPTPGQIRALAVLPLENLSGDKQQDYFAEGMTDALITSLAKIGALRVTSRTSVMSYKGSRKPLPEIARELHVDAVVEGSVVASGGQVRINAQLIQASNDQNLWAESYQRSLRDVLGLQDEVARTIAREIRISVTPQEQLRLTNARAINPEAQEAYLKGLYYSGIPAQRPKAVEYFQQAIQEDPGYAAPYAGLAEVYFARAFFDNASPKDTYPAMRDAVSKALERDETLPAAHADLALVKLHADWDWEGADREFRRALELNSSDADVRHMYAHFLMAMGREDESRAESERAVELDPVNVGLTACLGWHDVWASHYDQAVQQTLEALKMNPNFAWAKINLGWAYEQKSMFEEAIAEFQASVSNPGAGVLAMANLAHAYAVSGKTREAREVLAKVKERAGKSYVSPYQIAAIYAGLGDKQQAFEWLEKGYAERSTWMVYTKWDPRFANLRSDPRFQDLVRRIGLPL